MKKQLLLLCGIISVSMVCALDETSVMRLTENLPLYSADESPQLPLENDQSIDNWYKSMNLRTLQPATSETRELTPKETSIEKTLIESNCETLPKDIYPTSIFISSNPYATQDITFETSLGTITFITIPNFIDLYTEYGKFIKRIKPKDSGKAKVFFMKP